MVKLVIFDWDGTLFDSIDQICSSMLKAGENSNAPVRQYSDIKNIIGLSLDKAVQTVWPELDSAVHEQIMSHYKTIYVSSDMAPPSPYPGVYELLRGFKESGIKMAVATGKSRRGLDRVMALTETRHYFDVTRCADETQSKPHPLMIEQILDTLGVAPEHSIMVGDTEYDLNMANNAGIKSVGVSYGAHSKDRLLACNPHAVINHVSQLSDFLR